jgi:transcriptional regulator with XRE-family HTH domain
VAAVPVHAVRVLRTAKGKSLRALAADADLHFTTIDKIERGLAPTPNQLRKIARGLRLRESNLARAIALSNEVRD